MDFIKNIPVLIDFDGVIRIGDKIADDAGLFFDFLESNKLPFYIISNSTQTTGKDIIDILKSAGITANINAMTTIDATINYLKASGIKINIYCKEEMKKYFQEFITDNNPDALVIGDLEEGWTYDILNEIFRKVYNGADIIAMQKNKFWKPGGKKLALDAGAFITAIEYATGKNSLLIGKPSPIYFNTAIQKLGFSELIAKQKESNEFIMIGDDVTTDISGAKNLGGTGILIYTGKTKKNYDQINNPSADYDADNLTEVISTLKKLLNKQA